MASEESQKPLKPQETQETVELDDILDKLGAFGKYQLFTMAMLALVYATNSMYNVNYVFAVEDVNYRCKIPACESNNATFKAPWLDTAQDRIKQCYTHPPIDRNCRAMNTSIMEECTEWVYDVPDSFVAEFNLACQEWKATLIGTTHLFGSLVGQLIQGQISDRHGRKIAAVLAGSAGAILGIGKSFVSSYWLYVVLEGLEAAVGDALAPMFMLSIEIVSKKRAVMYQTVLLNIYTIGQVCLPWISRSAPYWRTFLRILYTPSLLVLTYSLLLEESVRWLLTKGYKEKAFKILKKTAARNNVDLDDDLLNRLSYSEKAENVDTKKVLIETFKSRIMVQRFLVCLVWWFTITLINYGMMISSVLLGGDKYLSFSLLVMMDIPANLLYWFALDKYARKMPLIISFVAGGLLCVTQPFLPKEYLWLGIAMLMIFELLATFSYNVVYMYTSEVFPTAARHSLHAMCGAAGRAAALLAPQLPLLMSIWSGLPSLVFGVLSLVSGCLTVLVPDTARDSLPDTLADAETLGRRQSRH